MLGAIIGDIAGSRFEFHSHKSKDFEFFAPACHPTDDSIMTLAIAQALLDSRPDYDSLSEHAIASMQRLGRQHWNAGYGGLFRLWLLKKDPKPYNSFGNGAAMRVSPCGFAAHSLEEAQLLSARATIVTHNHPEGLKGAEAAAVAIFLAASGADKAEMRRYIETHYYPLSFTLAEKRKTYDFDVTCQGTLPVALEAFFESTDFEDAIRNAISMGGDSDTIAAITGAIAEAYYGIPDGLRQKALGYLDEPLKRILQQFESLYPVKIQ